MPSPSEGPLGFLGRLASTFAGGSPDGVRHVWEGFAPWVQQLTMSAATRWLPYLILGIPCEVAEHGHACPQASISACGVCHRPCCLDHGMPAKDGAVCCRACFSAAVRAADPKIPPGAKPAGAGKAGRQKRATPPPRSEPPPGPNGGSAPRPKTRPPPEAFTRAHAVLGVSASTPWPDVERTYKTLLARWHPDHFPDHQKADAERRFKEIRSAYDFLKDHR